MHLNINRVTDVLEIDDAILLPGTFRNFEGRGDKFNREGDRYFHIAIPTEEMKDALLEHTNEDGAGWNVKIRPPRDEDETPQMHLKVKVKFTSRGPNIYLITGGHRVKLTEETVKCLDDVDIERVDLDIRPYDNFTQGRPFRTAYLQSMEVTQRMDRFAARIAEEEYPGEKPLPF